MTRWKQMAAALVLVLATGAAASAQSTHLLVIVGLAGDPEFAEPYSKWGASLVDAAGGSERFLERYAVVVCSDHGQTPVEHGVPLETAYADLRLFRAINIRGELRNFYTGLTQPAIVLPEQTRQRNTLLITGGLAFRF